MIKNPTIPASRLILGQLRCDLRPSNGGCGLPNCGKGEPMQTHRVGRASPARSATCGWVWAVLAPSDRRAAPEEVLACPAPGSRGRGLYMPRRSADALRGLRIPQNVSEPTNPGSAGALGPHRVASTTGWRPASRSRGAGHGLRRAAPNPTRRRWPCRAAVEKDLGFGPPLRNPSGSGAAAPARSSAASPTPVGSAHLTRPHHRIANTNSCRASYQHPAKLLTVMTHDRPPLRPGISATWRHRRRSCRRGRADNAARSAGRGTDLEPGAYD